MRAAPPPFSDAELIAAFPEMQIALPELGNGSFKAAYRVVTASGDAVLKVVKEPATLPQNPWGGKSATLPGNLRRASAVAFVIWLLAAVLILGRGGVIEVPVPTAVLTWGAWILVVVSALGALVNVASSSVWERFGWAPLAAAMAFLSAIVASS